MNVVRFEREPFRDAANTLRRIADEVESGTLGAVKVGALVILTEANYPHVFGVGPRADELQTLAAFKLGEQAMIDIILEAADGDQPDSV
ncbi:hypothetical protein VPH49_24290 [Pseudomonas luteola]|uniref:hypothetical protein n=1 Tax=Pseudomonas luteola TaxID=47886 RepID=UPI003A8AFE6A